MVLEAQRDNANRPGRQAVTAYLMAHFDPSGDDVIFVSMGSLAHYIHDLSAYGYQSTTSCTKGTATCGWSRSPAARTGWRSGCWSRKRAEGGDALYQRSLHHPEFLRGYQRVADGGGVALYCDTTQ